MTPEEQTQHDADGVRLAQEQTDREAATTAREAEEAQTAIDKASAKEKLMAAEYTPLTEAEADAITK